MKSMKPSFIIILSVFSILTSFASCDKEKPTIPENTTNQDNGNDNGGTTNDQIKITIDSNTFAATLNNSETATAFKAMLPLTINMSELNENEKYFYFSSNLPTNAVTPGTIQAGDLMLYGSDCLVLFYETFSTSYSYTRLGRIDNASGLVVAVGSRSVMVTFELD